MFGKVFDDAGVNDGCAAPPGPVSTQLDALPVMLICPNEKFVTNGTALVPTSVELLKVAVPPVSDPAVEIEPPVKVIVPAPPPAVITPGVIAPPPALELRLATV